MKSYSCFFTLIIFLGSAFFSTAWAAPSAKAVLVNAKGEEIGTAFFEQKGKTVKLKIKAEGLTPGPHGMHIHGAGKCETPDFKSAGPHFNPHQKQHGLKNPHGSHSGDLPNLVANKRGRAKATASLKGASLREGESHSLLKADGTAIVIHAGPDDEMTDPAGNSGDRIACGVIKKT